MPQQTTANGAEPTITDCQRAVKAELPYGARTHHRLPVWRPVSASSSGCRDVAVSRTPRSPSASSASRPTSGPPRPRRRDRCCASRRPARARRRRWSPGSPGWSTAARTRRRSCVVAFNKRAAEELTARLDAALAPLGRAGRIGPRAHVPRAGPRDARRGGRLGRPARRSRRAPARAVPGGAAPPTAGGSTSPSRASSSTSGSRPTRSRAIPSPGPVARAFVAYERAIAELGGVDFDDLVVRALGLLWRTTARPRDAGARRCANLLVDEAQDLDRTQLELALLLAAPGEQRLPRRRRRPDDLRLAARGRAARPRPRGVAARPAARRPRDQLPLPAAGRRARRPARRAQPRAVREADPGRARRPPAGSCSRRIAADDHVRDRARDARPGPPTTRRAPCSRGPTASCSSPSSSRSTSASRSGRRTCRCRSRTIGSTGCSTALPPTARSARRLAAGARRLRRDPARRGARGRTSSAAPDPADGPTPADLVDRDARLGRAAAVDRRRCARRSTSGGARLADAAPGRCGADPRDRARHQGPRVGPRRSCSPTGSRAAGRSADATEPERALEEERRLAYVAWTRARRSLTLLFDPQAPSPFLLEAFTARGARSGHRHGRRVDSGATTSTRRDGDPDAHAPRRDGPDDRPRLGVPAPRRARRRPAVRRAGSTTTRPRARCRSARRCRRRPRSSGSSAPSRTRARTATTSSPACSRTTGRSAPIGFFDLDLRQRQRGPRALHRRGRGPRQGPRHGHAQGAAALRVREPAARADRARLLRLQPGRAPPVPAGRASSTRGSRATGSSARAATSTCTRCRCSPTSGARRSARRPTPASRRRPRAWRGP